jgi:hypothetical protein
MQQRAAGAAPRPTRRGPRSPCAARAPSAGATSRAGVPHPQRTAPRRAKPGIPRPPAAAARPGVFFLDTHDEDADAGGDPWRAPRGPPPGARGGAATLAPPPPLPPPDHTLPPPAGAAAPPAALPAGGGAVAALPPHHPTVLELIQETRSFKVPGGGTLDDGRGPGTEQCRAPPQRTAEGSGCEAQGRAPLAAAPLLNAPPLNHPPPHPQRFNALIEARPFLRDDWRSFVNRPWVVRRSQGLWRAADGVTGRAACARQAAHAQQPPATPRRTPDWPRPRALLIPPPGRPRRGAAVAPRGRRDDGSAA